jgi:hypothetical protein
MLFTRDRACRRSPSTRWIRRRHKLDTPAEHKLDTPAAIRYD